MGLDHGAEVSVGEPRGTASAVGSRMRTTAIGVVAEEVEVSGNVRAMAVTVDLEDAMTTSGETEDLEDVMSGPHVNGIDRIAFC